MMAAHPDSHLASLSLFPATPEQTLASRKRSFPHWGRGLTELQYLTRDAHLDAQEHAANGKLTTWCVHPPPASQSEGVYRAIQGIVVEGCSHLPGLQVRFFRRKALVRKAGSKVPEEVVCYSIASVFTPPEHRGKGYARHMMSLLHWVIAPRDVLPSFPPAWGAPPPEPPGYGNGAFSTLYSDVGDLYFTAGPSHDTDGWVVREPVSTVWDVPRDGVPYSDAYGGVVWLDEEAAREIWKKDVDVMRADIASSPFNGTVFSFLPDAGVAAYQIQRALSFLTRQTSTSPRKWGVSLPETGTLTYATWTLDVRPPPATLVITRVRANSDTFPLLLPRVLQVARECGMEKVEVWNLPLSLVDSAHFMGGKNEMRSEHIDAFKWYGPEKEADIEWMFNEKFCWC